MLFASEHGEIGVSVSPLNPQISANHVHLCCLATFYFLLLLDYFLVTRRGMAWLHQDILLSYYWTRHFNSLVAHLAVDDQFLPVK